MRDNTMWFVSKVQCNNCMEQRELLTYERMDRIAIMNTESSDACLLYWCGKCCKYSMRPVQYQTLKFELEGFDQGTK